MGKMLSIMIGTIAAIYLTYTYLSNYFQPLLNWLEPVLGIPLKFMVGVSFLLFGSSFNFPIVLLSWIILSILIGVLSGNGINAFISALLTYIIIFLFLILNIFLIFYQIVSNNQISIFSINFLNYLPPPPPGTNLGTLINEPFLINLSKISFNYTTNSAQYSFFNFLTDQSLNIVINLIINIVIFLLASSLIGFSIRKLKEKNIKIKNKKKKIISIVILFILLFSIIFVQYGFVHESQINKTFVENLSYLQKNKNSNNLISSYQKDNFNSNAPEVLRIFPNVGNGYGNTLVEIIGLGFNNIKGVYFGKFICKNYIVINTSLIYAWSPPGNGSVNILVENETGFSSPSQNNLFTYASVTSIEPKIAPTSGYTAVTINGNGFYGNVKVFFGKNESLESLVLSPEKIVAIVPPGNGSVNLTVELSNIGIIPIDKNVVLNYVTDFEFSNVIEGITSYINNDGSITNFYEFLNLSKEISNPLFQNTHNPVFVFVVSQSGELNFVPSMKRFSLINGIIPPTMILLGYIKNYSAAESLAANDINSIANVLSLRDISMLISGSFNFSYIYNILNYLGISYNTGLAKEYSNLSWFLYSSQTTIDKVFYGLEQKFLPIIGSDGLINIFTSEIDDGYLIPSYNSNSVNGITVLFGSGNISLTLAILHSIFPDISISGVPNSYYLNFITALTIKNDVVHSSELNHTINIGTTLDYSKSVLFSPYSKLSYIGISAPENTTYITNNPILFSGYMNANTKIKLFGYGQNITPNDLNLSFNGLYPPNIKIKKYILNENYDTVKVYINITNLDDQPIENLVLNDSNFLNYYKNSIILISGSFYNNLSYLQPNGSIVYSYTLKVLNSGSYDLGSAIISFNFENRSYQKSSNNLYLVISNPDFIHGINYLMIKIGNYISPWHIYFFGFYINVGVLLELFLFFIFILICIYEIDSYLTRRKTGKNHRE
jgi:hypothetical protein